MNPEDDPQAAQVEGLDAARVMARALQTPQTLHPLWEPLEPAALAPLLPAYEVIELIGRGGLGAVYQARHKSLDRLVALKVLPLETSLDEGFAIRFQNEARLLAKLQHPNIVAVYDTGTTSEGHLFLVMELVEGTDVATLIHESPLAPAKALDVTMQVCAALKFAHEQGVVHRDIKPSNIMIGNDRVVKVADFGLAKLYTEGPSLSSPTLTGTIMGTPDYMAPEQRSGGAVDQRTDIYSLGVLIYEMLTGQVPRGAWDPPSKRAGVDPRLDGVVTKAMQHEPGKRYQNAEEVSAAVQVVRDSAEVPRWKRILNTELVSIGPRYPSGVWLIYILVVWGFMGVPPAAWKEWWSPKKPGAQTSSVPDYQKSLTTEAFAALVLPAKGQSGNWRWQDGTPGGVLTIGPGIPEQASVLTLPVEGDHRTYSASFDLWLDKDQSDAGLIFPAGHAQTGLVLNLQRITGIGFIGGKAWNDNPTTTSVRFPVQGWNRVHVYVSPVQETVKVRVSLNGATIMEWQGNQDQLTLYRDPRRGWPVDGDHVFGLASYSGNASFRNLRITWLKAP